MGLYLHVPDDADEHRDGDSYVIAAVTDSDGARHLLTIQGDANALAVLVGHRWRLDDDGAPDPLGRLGRKAKTAARSTTALRW